MVPQCRPVRTYDIPTRLGVKTAPRLPRYDTTPRARRESSPPGICQKQGTGSKPKS